MGISHAEFGPRGIKNEWILFDETMIWKQNFNENRVIDEFFNFNNTCGQSSSF